mmetsp:Transcript_18751/g.43934  ORF Transcript_18751/g.43934 Transcript_18751/m.43934 type:complete len:226 (+) Transcript_18751:193-870(+)
MPERVLRAYPPRRVPLEHPLDQVPPLHAHRPPLGRGVVHVRPPVRLDELPVRLPQERLVPRQHDVHRDTRREDVGPVSVPAVRARGEYLGGDEAGRAAPSPYEVVHADERRHAEVGELDSGARRRPPAAPVPAHEQVRRLDVAVRHSHLVEDHEARQQVPHDRRRLDLVEDAPGRHVAEEVGPPQELELEYQRLGRLEDVPEAEEGGRRRAGRRAGGPGVRADRE